MGPSQLKEILVAQHEQEFRHFMNDETFFQSVILDPAPKEVFENVAAPGYVKAPANAQVSERSQAFVSKDPLVSEVYTNSQNFMKEALKRGHQVGTPMSLETGWDFRRADHRKRAYQTVMDEKPFCLVIAFPCNVFSPLQFLNPHGLEGLPQRRQESLELMRFGIELAKLQVREGRHFILENPLPSAAWKEPEMQAFLEEYQIDTAVFDQCRYGLKSLAGRPHRKATKIASSSDAVIKSVDGNRCTRTHVHDPVIGGAKVTARAGIYPRALARAMVRSVEEQFEKQYDLNSGNVGEVLAAEAEDDEGIDFVQNSGAFALNEDDLSDVEEQTEDDSQVRISQSVKLAIRRLHENTGHRSNVRLARALAIAGAPPEAIIAAKRHRCDVCAERVAPKARRPASLPTPRDMGDQVHIDLLEIEDIKENKFFVVHCTDSATRFQMAEVLKDKSTASVVRFLSTKWLPVFGAPRVLVADQGREFISWEMEEWASSVSTLLHHIAVQAPWQNGIAERSGGALKAVLSAIVAAQSVLGFDDMQVALGEAVYACNADINESGASPFQAAVGRQPRMVGDVLGGIQNRLAEHGLVSSKPSLARQIAMRETAKVSMCRLHFSRGVRKAELARSRSTTIEEAPAPGTVCYFYRPVKYNRKGAGSRKKLTLKRWHGPALLVALEGHASAFLSYKGQLTKCALEHVRVASTMEQIAAETWREAIDEVVEAARQDAARQEPEEAPVGDAESLPAGENPRTPAFLPSSPAPAALQPASADGGADLPPLQPQELVGAMLSLGDEGGNGLGSVPGPRRMSDVSFIQSRGLFNSWIAPDE